MKGVRAKIGEVAMPATVRRRVANNPSEDSLDITIDMSYNFE
jgi:hypothetical protein